MKKLLFGTAAVLAGVTMLSALALAENDDHDKMMQHEEIRKVGSTLEVHISDNGNVLMRGAKVTKINGSTITAANTWGSATLSWTVNTNSNTSFIRRFGGTSSLSEISVGDIVSVQGTLVTTTSELTIQAKTVKDWSIQKQNASVSGTIESVNSSDGSFMLKKEEGTVIKVMVGSATDIKKGDQKIAFADLKTGTTIRVTGLLNTAQNVLEASQVKAPAENVQSKQTLQGKVKSVTTTSGAMSLVLTVDNTDYTLKIASDTSILNVLWLRTPLTNFKEGDTVRVYGAVTGTTVDATVVRDTSIRL